MRKRESYTQRQWSAVSNNQKYLWETCGGTSIFKNTHNNATLVCHLSRCFSLLVRNLEVRSLELRKTEFAQSKILSLPDKPSYLRGYWVTRPEHQFQCHDSGQSHGHGLGQCPMDMVMEYTLNEVWGREVNVFCSKKLFGWTSLLCFCLFRWLSGDMPIKQLHVQRQNICLFQDDSRRL